MKRYLKIFWALALTASKRYLEYRWNTFGAVISSVMSLLIVVLFVEIIFSQVQNIVGWKKSEMLFFVGLFRVFSALLSLLFIRGINFLPNYIQRGDMDIFLSKPIDTQFFISLRFTRAYEIINLIPGVALMSYALRGVETSIINWLLLALGIVCGLLIFYGLYFMCATLAFWLVRFSALTSVNHIINSFLSFPTDIFGKNGSSLLTYLIPLGFIVTVPVKIFFARYPPFFILGGIFFAALSVWLSVKFWNYSLKRYTSASS